MKKPLRKLTMRLSLMKLILKILLGFSKHSVSILSHKFRDPRYTTRGSSVFSLSGWLQESVSISFVKMSTSK